MFEIVEEKGSLFVAMQKITEAHCDKQGIPINRRFSADELAESAQEISEAERLLQDGGCPLSPDERALFDELDRRTIPFAVAVTTPIGSRQIVVLASDACMATLHALDRLFEFNTPKPQSFKIRVEPVKQAGSLRVAA